MLEAEGLFKRFGGVQALDGVSLHAAPGRIHALLGENGAGKSTLLKCLSGVHAPDAGTMRIGGARFAPGSPRGAEEAGLRIVHQELNLVPAFTAVENAFLGRAYPRRGLLVDWKAMRARFAEAQARFGLDVPADVPVARLSVAKRQIVEILRSLAWDARVLVLDEPTASLSEVEASALHAILRRLVEAGRTIVLVSHRIEEVLALAHDFTVLRNGRAVGAGRIEDTDRAALLELMAGGAGEEREVRPTSVVGSPVLRLSAFRPAEHRAPLDLRIGAGEIVGLYGVVGSGRSSLLEAVWGARKGASGGIELAGRTLPPAGIPARIAADVAFASEDRRGAGLIMAHSVLDNAVLPQLARHRRAPRLPVVAWSRARSSVTATLARLAVRSRRLADPIRSLSGGNQQKIMIGRWLRPGLKLLLLDEPTRGVDMRSKAEIHALCRDLAEQGAALLFASSDIEEVLALSSRVLVMAQGSIVLDVPAANATRHRLVHAALGAH